MGKSSILKRDNFFYEKGKINNELQQKIVQQNFIEYE